MANKAPPETHTNVMHDIAIAFISHPWPLGKSRCSPVQPTKRPDSPQAGVQIPLRAFAECRLGRQSIAARYRLATLVLFRLGGGGNCRSLREHCSPVMNQ